MSTANAKVASMLEALPDSSSFEDIQYHLYVLEKVNRGFAVSIRPVVSRRSWATRSPGSATSWRGRRINDQPQYPFAAVPRAFTCSVPT